MANGGFYLMHRGWMDNPAFGKEPFTDREAWLWMIENAWYKPGPCSFNQLTCEIARGQLPTTYRTLMKTFGWGQGRLSGYILRLKKHGMVDTRTDTPFLVINIEKYERYQQRSDTRTDTKSDTKSDTLYIEKERKEKKRSAQYAPPLKDGGASSAPNLAPDFFKLRGMAEYSQLPDDEIYAMVLKQNGSAM